jgi:hypothetical protein
LSEERVNVEDERNDRYGQGGGARDIDRRPVEKSLHERDSVENRELASPGERAAAAARDLHETQTPAAALGDVFL